MRRILLSAALVLAVPAAVPAVPADPKPLLTLAVSADNRGQTDIFLVRPGGEPRNLTDHKAADETPAWSPDGKRIAFVSDREQGVRHVFVMDADGKNVTKVTKGDAPCLGPAWSPDGKQIAYVSAVRGVDQIHAVDPDGKNARQLTKAATAARMPAWSPDGKSVAFAHYLQDRPYEVWVMDADGGNAKSLSKGSGLDPSWSPDGKRVTFTGIRDGAGFRVYAADADGGNLTALSESPNPWGNVYPRFAPDGKRVAFTDWVAGAAQIAVADADGKNRKALTKAGTNYIARWSPDGKRLAFLRSGKFFSGVVVVDPETGKEEEVIGAAGGFDWRPLPPE